MKISSNENVFTNLAPKLHESSMISFYPVALTETTIETPTDTQGMRIPQSWKQLGSEMQGKFHINSIINNFLRKSGGRGPQPPGSTVPDNATKLKSAAKEFKELIRSPRLQENMISQGILELGYSSSWQGQTWQRLIKSVKQCVVKVVRRANLGFHEINGSRIYY